MLVVVHTVVHSASWCIVYIIVFLYTFYVYTYIHVHIYIYIYTSINTVWLLAILLQSPGVPNSGTSVVWGAEVRALWGQGATEVRRPLGPSQRVHWEIGGEHGEKWWWDGIFPCFLTGAMMTVMMLHGVCQMFSPQNTFNVFFAPFSDVLSLHQ